MCLISMEGDGPHTVRSFNLRAQNLHDTADNDKTVLYLEHVHRSSMEELQTKSMQLEDASDLVVRELVGDEGHFYGVRMMPDQTVLVLDASVGKGLETDTSHFWDLVLEEGKDIELFQLLDYNAHDVEVAAIHSSDEVYDLPGGADCENADEHPLQPNASLRQGIGKLIMDTSWELRTPGEQEKQYLIGLLLLGGLSPDPEQFIFEAAHACSPICYWRDACMPATFQHLGVPCNVRSDGPFLLTDGQAFLLRHGLCMAPSPVHFRGQYALTFQDHMMALVVGSTNAILFNGHWSVPLSHADLRRLLTNFPFSRILGIFRCRRSDLDGEALLTGEQTIHCPLPGLPELFGASSMDGPRPAQIAVDPALFHFRRQKGHSYMSAAACDRIPEVWQDRFFVCGLLSLAGYNPGEFDFEMSIEHARSPQRLCSLMCAVTSFLFIRS